MLTVKLSGFKELDLALAELPKATAKNVLKRTLIKAAKPLDDAASAAAPYLTGGLQKSVITGTKLTSRQRSSAYRGNGTNGFVEVYVGTSLSKGIFTEFGTFKDAAQPWFTPAWESQQGEVLGIIRVELGTQIEKSAARLARKAAKA